MLARWADSAYCTSTMNITTTPTDRQAAEEKAAETKYWEELAKRKAAEAVKK